MNTGLDIQAGISVYTYTRMVTIMNNRRKASVLPVGHEHSFYARLFFK
jgi:hypothetical protein